MAVVPESSGEAPKIKDGPYSLTVVSAITGIREGPDKYNPEIVDAPIVHINMAVGGTRDEDGNEIVLRSTMNLKFSRGGSYPPSTLYLYARAFGVVPEVGELFDTDWLVGKKAQGMVRTDKEGTWPKVVNESLVPAGEPAQKGPARAQEARSVAPDDLPWEDAEADRNALESFYEAGDQYARRSEIKSTSQSMFDNRLPEALTTQEREQLLAEIKRGVSA